MRITEIWFEGEDLCGRDENGKVYRQSLLWYPPLQAATDGQRSRYPWIQETIERARDVYP